MAASGSEKLRNCRGYFFRFKQMAFVVRFQNRLFKVIRIGLKALFSQVGTLIMVILYLLIGGYLFQYLEQENEVEICKIRYNKYFLKLNESVSRVSSIATAMVTESEIRVLSMTVLQEFADDIFKLNFQPSKNCSTIGSAGNWPEWNLVNAIYFSATVITTIGYGHLTPQTMWGRIICMIYAILGIPIMLLFLTNVGEVMATLFRFLYFNLCCCRCFGQGRKQLAPPPSLSPVLPKVELPSSAVTLPRDSCASLSSRNGRPLQPPSLHNAAGGSSLPVPLSPNLGSCDSLPRTESSETSHGNQKGGKHVAWNSGGYLTNSAMVPPPKVSNIIVEDAADSDNDVDDEDDENMDLVVIPISVILLVLFVYVLMGAVLFRAWETDWGLIDGTYFSFVTLSTIGFGDLVPGKDGFEKAETGIEMALGAIYCLFGLAILSMCLNLIQDELAAKFHWLGQKLGVSNVDDEDDVAPDNNQPQEGRREEIPLDRKFEGGRRHAIIHHGNGSLDHEIGL